MRIDILTLFPQMFAEPFNSGIFQRAAENGLVEVNTLNIRDFTHDKHHVADDYPYGGGAGMVMKPDPVFEAVESIRQDIDIDEEGEEPPVILLTPQGRPFTQAVAQELSQHRHIILVCGHYEGIDERVHEYLATDEISIGDYVLSGGEPAAIVVTDAIVRLLPGVLGSEDSAKDDSHSNGLLEYPQYTRPSQFREWQVPEILLSGNHGQIAEWRRRQSVMRTLKRRPELLQNADLSDDEKQYIIDYLIDNEENGEKNSEGQTPPAAE